MRVHRQQLSQKLLQKLKRPRTWSALVEPNINHDAASHAASDSVDGGSTYSTDSKEEEAAAEAESAAQTAAELAAAALLITASSAPEPIQQRYPRQRRPPTEIYKAQAAKTEMLEKPQTYTQAIQDEDAAEWRKAMDEEMASLLD